MEKIIIIAVAAIWGASMLFGVTLLVGSRYSTCIRRFVTGD
ncbi:hypothetical protein C8J25_102328 [Sphingomonas faeni]|uniref:Uncharacterized protein n=1 Tax=Sphingomonas faeni TaxID=185950 RepID=A0A2T5U9Q4_9SPHN|nr:hypothetical protein [Sphingomonas faeni]PTW48236.1 hypothetical protein C8J25_102328 [Sphingomonas faeni]